MRRALPLLLAVAACDSAEQTRIYDSEPATGHLTYGIGQDVREVGFSETRCTDEPAGVTLVELLSNQIVPGPQGRPQRPRVLIARIRGDEVLEATAFVAGARHGDDVYPMLHFVRGTCRIEAAVLACNDSEIVGWLGNGPPPKPSYKALLECPPD